MSEEQSSANNVVKIIYFGDDKGYFHSLQNAFRKDFEKTLFEFYSFYEKDAIKAQSLVIEIFEHSPAAILVDLSKDTETMLHLLRLFVKTNSILKHFVGALMDITTPKDIIKSGIMTNCPVVHVKSSELEAVTLSVGSFILTDVMKEHGFATAELKDEVFAYSPCKVGIVSPAGVKVESGIQLSDGQNYGMKSFWHDKGILQSSKVYCANQYIHDLYYNYDFSQEFGVEFAPPVEKDEDTPADIIEDRERRRVQLEKDLKERMFDWVVAHQRISHPKKIRLLVVDKTFSFYNNQPLSDIYPYVIRCQPYLKYVKKELMHEYSQLIAYNFEEVEPEELKANEELAFSYNEINNLTYIVKTIKSIENYRPYIIVFNSKKHDTAYFQQALDYKWVISYSDKISPPMVIKMAGMLEDKLQSNTEEYEVPTVFLPKNHEATYAEIEIPVTVLGISEQDAYFLSAVELQVGVTIRLFMHVDIFVTVAPQPTTSKYPEAYYGVVHGLNEKDKMELRRWVNSVFFRQLEEQKAAERAEVAQIKEAAIQKKIEEEEEAKRKAEEEEQLRLQEEERKVKEEIAKKEAASAAAEAGVSSNGDAAKTEETQATPEDTKQEPVEKKEEPDKDE